MAQRANVKPLIHWVSRQGHTMRFTERQADHVAGILNTPDGPVEFTYDAVEQVVQLPKRNVSIDDYGWEKGRSRNEYGSVTFEPPPSGAPSTGGPPFKKPPDDKDDKTDKT